MAKKKKTMIDISEFMEENSLVPPKPGEVIIDESDKLTYADMEAMIKFWKEQEIAWEAHEWAVTAVPPPLKMSEVDSADKYLNKNQKKPKKDDAHQFDHLLPDEFNEPEKPPKKTCEDILNAKVTITGGWGTYGNYAWYPVDPLPKLTHDIGVEMAKEEDKVIIQSLLCWPPSTMYTVEVTEQGVLKGWTDEYGKWEVVVYPQTDLLQYKLGLKLYPNTSTDILGCIHHISENLFADYNKVNLLLSKMKSEIVAKL